LTICSRAGHDRKKEGTKKTKRKPGIEKSIERWGRRKVKLRYREIGIGN
jgi:hypothetical protein